MARMNYAKSDRIAYRASKAAVNKLTAGTLATDLAGESIAVRAIDPGWARTDMGGPEADVEGVGFSSPVSWPRAWEVDMASTEALSTTAARRSPGERVFVPSGHRPATFRPAAR